jgi:hypothetical protein
MTTLLGGPFPRGERSILVSLAMVNPPLLGEVGGGVVVGVGRVEISPATSKENNNKKNTNGMLGVSHDADAIDIVC